VPSAGKTDNQMKSTLGNTARRIRGTLLRKMTEYFRRPLRIFPQKLHPPHKGNGKTL
jgi:hypothetical protein